MSRASFAYVAAAENIMAKMEGYDDAPVRQYGHDQHFAASISTSRVFNKRSKAQAGSKWSVLEDVIVLQQVFARQHMY